jgi:hypothetical protein
VWRSRYDGPNTSLPDPLPPGFEHVAKQLHATHSAVGIGICQGGDGLSGRLHAAWGDFAVTGTLDWPAYDTTSRHTMMR